MVCFVKWRLGTKKRQLEYVCMCVCVCLPYNLFWSVLGHSSLQHNLIHLQWSCTSGDINLVFSFTSHWTPHAAVEVSEDGGKEVARDDKTTWRSKLKAKWCEIVTTNFVLSLFLVKQSTLTLMSQFCFSSWCFQQFLCLLKRRNGQNTLKI